MARDSGAVYAGRDWSYPGRPVLVERAPVRRCGVLPAEANRFDHPSGRFLRPEGIDRHGRDPRPLSVVAPGGRHLHGRRRPRAETRPVKQIRTQIDIDASADSVWSVLIDLARYQEWNPVIRHAGGTVAEGASVALFVVTPGLASRRVSVTLVTVEPQRALRWVGTLLFRGVLDGDHRFILEPLSPTKTRLIHSEVFSGISLPLIARVLLPQMTLGFDRMNVALKHRAEENVKSAP